MQKIDVSKIEVVFSQHTANIYIETVSSQKIFSKIKRINSIDIIVIEFFVTEA